MDALDQKRIQTNSKGKCFLHPDGAFDGSLFLPDRVVSSTRTLCHTLLPLSQMDHDPRNPTYISSQGPLPSTVADFWQVKLISIHSGLLFRACFFSLKMCCTLCDPLVSCDLLFFASVMLMSAAQALKRESFVIICN